MHNYIQYTWQVYSSTWYTRYTWYTVGTVVYNRIKIVDGDDLLDLNLHH
jgi:hypothetical protein